MKQEKDLLGAPQRAFERGKCAVPAGPEGQVSISWGGGVGMKEEGEQRVSRQRAHV